MTSVNLGRVGYGSSGPSSRLMWREMTGKIELAEPLPAFLGTEDGRRRGPVGFMWDQGGEDHIGRRMKSLC